MYVRRVQDRTLEFGHRGWLVDESFIFYDRRYDSLWVQATGVCIQGKFKNERLPTLPVTHTTWGEWRALHPETLVLAKPAPLIERYRKDGYAAYYEKRGTEVGLAVFVGDQQKLYPLKRLENAPVVHDTIAERPVLVVFHAQTQTAVAFDPFVDGNRLELELAEVTGVDVLLRERSSGTIWSGLMGRPHCGDESQPRLIQLRTSQFVVANWLKHFPNGLVFGSP